MLRTSILNKAKENLMKISRTARSDLLTTDKAGRTESVVLQSNHENTINDLIIGQKDKEFKSSTELRVFIEDIMKSICSGLVEEHGWREKIYRTRDSVIFPYTPAVKLDTAIIQFCEALFNRLKDQKKDPENFDYVETAAWVEYRLNLTDHFFIDGCGKTANALAMYILIRGGKDIPDYPDRTEIYKHAPKKYRDTDDELNDIQFQDWLKFYKTLFKEKIIHQPFKDEKAWNIDSKEIEKRHEAITTPTYLQTSIVLNTKYLQEVCKITEKDYLDIVCFSLDRLLLHELIVYLSINYQFQDDDSFQNKVDEIFKVLKTEPAYAEFNNFISKDSGQLLEKRFNIISKQQYAFDPFKPIFDEFHAKFNNYIKINKKSVSFDEINTLQDLFNNMMKDLLRDSYLKEEVQKLVKLFLESNAKNFNLKHLSYYKNQERVSWVIVGGSASGKTSISKEIKDLIKEDLWSDICRINPDAYKGLLLSESQKLKMAPELIADVTHEESSIISKKIISRVLNIIKTTEEGPYILIDTVKPSKEKDELSVYGGATANIFIASCPAEVAVYRAYHRGRKVGRFVPPKAVLIAHKKSSELIPMAIGLHNTFLKIYNTYCSPYIKTPVIAAINDYSRNLAIYAISPFLEMIKKSHLNVDAKSEDEMYGNEFEKYSIYANMIMSYVLQGITINFVCERGKIFASLNSENGLVITDLSQMVLQINNNRKKAAEFIRGFTKYHSEKIKFLMVTIHEAPGLSKIFYSEGEKIVLCNKKKLAFPELLDELDIAQPTERPSPVDGSTILLRETESAYKKLSANSSARDNNFNIAVSAYHRGFISKAISSLEALISAERPKIDINAYTCLANCYKKSREYVKALQLYETILNERFTSRNRDIYLTALKNLLKLLSDDEAAYEKAVRKYEKYIEMLPKGGKRGRDLEAQSDERQITKSRMEKKGQDSPSWPSLLGSPSAFFPHSPSSPSSSSSSSSALALASAAESSPLSSMRRPTGSTSPRAQGRK